MPNLIKLYQKPTLEEVAASLQFPVKTKLDERPKFFDSLCTDFAKELCKLMDDRTFSTLLKRLCKGVLQMDLYLLLKRKQNIYLQTHAYKQMPARNLVCSKSRGRVSTRYNNFNKSLNRIINLTLRKIKNLSDC